MITGRDILPLWVARMIFSGMEYLPDMPKRGIPFYRVYVHPTVQNFEGKRMSKSLGTGVDPLELMDKYGTDATRFGLCSMATATQDVRLQEDARGRTGTRRDRRRRTQLPLLRAGAQLRQ